MEKRDSTNKVSFGKMRSLIFFGLIILLSIVMIYLFRPFLYPIFWAAVIAITFYPVHKHILNRFKKPGLSASTSVILVFLIIFVPLSALSALLVNESLELYDTVSKSSLFQDPGQVSSWIENTPLAPYVENIRSDWTTYATNATQWLSGFLFTSVKSVTQNSLRFILMMFVMLYTLYYFFKDGANMLKKLMHISPLGDKYESMLYERFTSTTRATLKSTLIVGGIQGLLSGLLFWITGIEGAFVWGVIMVIIAIIPAVGTSIVLAPTGIIMLALGNGWEGLVLLIGAGIISILDNVMRPPLVGKDTQMHPLLVFFATLGGLILFGISGFIIGPVIAALYISIMSIYEHYYKGELQNN
ncbi:AI-2E family transporter [Candidatus Parcubacteria bacterium]|jgi:predicted PurR-regulated permease PerM|nr:AI-2E family transporter [Candidatus Parcubacteria bacterium]MBT3949416.1 AI-2E family transporter [Candidatus Parcubacteria bacterium]